MREPLYLRGNIWWCRVRNPNGGRHAKVSTGCRDRAAAVKRWRELERKSFAPADQTKNSPPLGDALDNRIAERRSAGRAEGTIDMLTKKAKHLNRVLGSETPLNCIDAQAIDRYVDVRTKEGSKSTTLHKELSTLRGALRLARRRGEYRFAVDEVMPLDFAPKYKPKTRALSVNEVNRLLADLPPKRAAVVAFICATGATYPTEADPFRPAADIQGNLVHLRGTKRETRDRWIPVQPWARAWFAFARKHGPFEAWTNVRGDLHEAAARLSMCDPCAAARRAWSRHEVGATKPSKDECKACKRAARFEPCSPNDLRRTFGHQLRAHGVEPHLIGAMMGHIDSRMAERVYAKLQPGELAHLLEQQRARGTAPGRRMA